MTITYNLASEHQRRYVYPASYGASAGLPIVGGKLYTFESNAHTTPKTTKSSNEGSPPPDNTNPIILDSNGECVIYWEFDDANPAAASNYYYVELRDPNDVLIDSYDMYNGVPYPVGSASSGGNFVNNYCRNPQFNWNRFKQIYKLSTIPAPLTKYTGTYVCDDWLFTKSTNGATETIEIASFVPGSQEAQSDASKYLSWACTVSGAAETYRFVFQKYGNVQTLAGQTATFQFLANSTQASQVNIYARQYFGTGGSPSPDVETLLAGPINLTSTMNVYSGTVQIPSILNKTIGTNGDSRLQLEIRLPINTIGQVGCTNIALTSTASVPTFPYQTLEEQQRNLDLAWFSVPTGDIKQAITLQSENPGWLYMNNGTIGNALSGGTAAIGEDAYALFAYLWDNTADAQCGVLPGGRGASALVDFDANKTINLPLSLDRFNIAAGSSYVLAGTGGSPTSNALLAHTHPLSSNPATPYAPFSDGSWTPQSSTPGGTDTAPVVSSVAAVGGGTATGSTGSGTDFSILPPYVAFYTFIKF